MTTLAAVLVLVITIALLRIAALLLELGVHLLRTEFRWRRAIREHRDDSTDRRAARMTRAGTLTW